jgi:hypothetical protein
VVRPRVARRCTPAPPVREGLLGERGPPPHPSRVHGRCHPVALADAQERREETAERESQAMQPPDGGREPSDGLVLRLGRSPSRSLLHLSAVAAARGLVRAATGPKRWCTHRGWDADSARSARRPNSSAPRAWPSTRGSRRAVQSAVDGRRWVAGRLRRADPGTAGPRRGWGRPRFDRRRWRPGHR